MKRFGRIVGLIVGVAATAAFAFYAAGVLRAQDLRPFATWQAMLGLGLAAMAYALIIPVSAWAWRGLLRDLGVVLTWSELAAIMGLTQMAKYLPGNVGHHIGRAGMSLSRNITVRTFVISVGSETALAILAAAVVGLAGASLSRAGARLLPSGTEWSTAAVIALAGLATVLLTTKRILPRFVRLVARGRIEPSTQLGLPRGKSLLLAFLAYCANYILIGAGLGVMARLVCPDHPVEATLLASAFALAWVAGFVTPGASAGLGVREGLMLAMLSTSLNQPEALLLTIATRFATTAGDAICFLASLVFEWWRRRSRIPAKPPLEPSQAHEP